MPPLRTMPIAKPLKTERTHEENQERAYIAASRRSDRSLEARVESARRASEIHKKRTGRSLRVTEQDVVNEEMYEEEDDDLPMQYRRLTAHLQTTNADFDRRLAAYLTNHVAMRTALGAAVSSNYAHPNYANAPQFANQMPQFMQQTFPNPMLPPPQMAARSPQSVRQPSHPVQNQQSHRPAPHNCAVSIATPQELHNQTVPSPQSPVNSFKSEERRMSLPAQDMPNTQAQVQQTHEPMSRTISSGSLANLKHEAARQGLLNSGTRQSSPSQQQPSTFPSPVPMPSGPDMSGNVMDRSPFSMALPMESQQLLGPMLDGSNPLHAMLLGKQEYAPQQSFYSYNPNGPSKTKGFSPGDGMNQTLAPSMLDPMLSYFGNYSMPDPSIDPSSGSLNFDNNYNDMFKSSASGLTTPGEHDWASLINASVWEDSSQQTTA